MEDSFEKILSQERTMKCAGIKMESELETAKRNFLIILPFHPMFHVKF
jgi:hypothetical protein